MFLLYCSALLFFLLIFHVYRKIKETTSIWDKRGVPCDHETSLWRFLHNLITKSAVESVIDIYNQFPNKRYFGIYFLLKPMLIVKDLELVKTIMVKDFDYFMDRRRMVKAEIDPLWGHTLIALEGEKWRDIRTTITPSFTGSKMRLIFDLVNEAALQFVEFHKNKYKHEFEVEMKDITSRFTNDVIATAVFGIKVDSFENPNNEFYSMGKDVTNFSGLRLVRMLVASINASLAEFLKIRMIPAYLSEYFSGIITETMKMREEQRITRPDMIHLMTEAMKSNKKIITRQDIISQAFVFFIGGFDSISSALSFLLYELALNPDIQQKLAKEIDSHESTGFTYEDLQGMRYLDMVISESLRKWPPNVTVERIVTKPYTIEPTEPDENPLELMVGDLIAFQVIGFHRDPKYFPDPDKFDPERFNDENKQQIPQYAYMPFGFGPRHCIGTRFALMEMKLFAVNFLSHFQVYPVAKTRIPMVLKKNSINLVAEGEMYLGIKERR